jgi:hypothetical protein
MIISRYVVVKGGPNDIVDLKSSANLLATLTEVVNYGKA